MITLARPELLERRPTWGAGQRNFTSIYLEPLSERGDGRAARRPRPRPPRGRCASRSSTAPRACRSTPSRRCACSSTAALSCRTAPSTGRRRDRVARGPRDAARADRRAARRPLARRAAAAPGRRRARQDVHRARARGPRRDAARLTSSRSSPALVRKEVLSLQTDPRSPEHGQYGFLQDLVRHVAYETLARRERRTRHLAAAAYLEREHRRGRGRRGDRGALRRRSRSAPDADDAAEIRAKARDALTRAGERATALAASAEAHRYFRRAAELADEPLDAGDAARPAGQAALLANLPVEGRALLERAHDLLSEANRRARRSCPPGSPTSTTRKGTRRRPLRVSRQPSRRSPNASRTHTSRRSPGQLGRFLVLSGEGRPGDAARRAGARASPRRLDLPEVLSQPLNTKGASAAARVT